MVSTLTGAKPATGLAVAAEAAAGRERGARGRDLGLLLGIAGGLAPGALLTAKAMTNVVNCVEQLPGPGTDAEWAALGPQWRRARLLAGGASGVYDGETISRFDVAATGVC